MLSTYTDAVCLYTCSHNENSNIRTCETVRPNVEIDPSYHSEVAVVERH